MKIEYCLKIKAINEYEEIIKKIQLRSVASVEVWLHLVNCTA